MGAKERNEYLTPGDPQSSHVLSTALGKHLSISADHDIAEGDSVVLVLSLSFLSQSPHVSPQKLTIATNLAVGSLCYATTGGFVEEGGLVDVPLSPVSNHLVVCSLSGADLVLVSLHFYQ